jgi:O-acetyl-ADP-ribose deacetylase
VDRVTLVEGDITTLQVDAIVNAANSSLLGGGGVDGAIHRAAGPDLLKECRLLGGCEPGEAKVTSGYRLPARWVIHTVGPVWRGGRAGEEETLRDCYRHALMRVVELRAASVAFPSISTGLYGYPVERAARVAVQEVRRHLAESLLPEQVTFVAFDATTYEVYRGLLEG